MTHRYTRLITAEQLAQLQAEGAPLMVFDCSFNLFEPEEADRLFAQSHIAGSQQAHLERNLSAQPGQSAASGGRHPLPTREAFASWLGRCGFANDMQAVVYDRNGMNFCGLDRAGNFLRFFPIYSIRSPCFHPAETAGARTDVTQNHKSSCTMSPALAHIRATS